MLAVASSFLAARGFATGNVLVWVGAQRVPAPTAALLTVLSGMILVVGTFLSFVGVVLVVWSAAG